MSLKFVYLGGWVKAAKLVVDSKHCKVAACQSILFRRYGRDHENDCSENKRLEVTYKKKDKIK